MVIKFLTSTNKKHNAVGFNLSSFGFSTFYPCVLIKSVYELWIVIFVVWSLMCINQGTEN